MIRKTTIDPAIDREVVRRIMGALVEWEPPSRRMEVTEVRIAREPDPCEPDVECGVATDSERPIRISAYVANAHPTDPSNRLKVWLRASESALLRDRRFVFMLLQSMLSESVEYMVDHARQTALFGDHDVNRVPCKRCRDAYVKITDQIVNGVPQDALGVCETCRSPGASSQSATRSS